jgi:DNA-binding transcriptional LysR family regulator
MASADNDSPVETPPIAPLEQVIDRSLIELRDLRTFVTVSEAANICRAAKILGVDRSTTSRRIAVLEDAVGVSLFERNRDGVKLTHAGKAFLAHVVRSLAILDSAVIEACGAGAGQAGRLRLGVITSFSRGFQRELLCAYRDSLPNVTIMISEGERSDLLTRLQHRQLDAAIVTGDITHECESLILCDETIYVALPAGHVLAARETLAWTQLVDEHFIVNANEPGLEIHEHIIRRLADLGKHPRVTRHDVARETLMNLVGMRFGVTMASESWSGVAYPKVVMRPIVDCSPPLRWSLAWLNENDNPVLRRFLSIARVQARNSDLAASAPRGSELHDR